MCSTSRSLRSAWSRRRSISAASRTLPTCPSACSAPAPAPERRSSPPPSSSDRVAAVVSRGGRPDLAGSRLAEVMAPTLLIVGGDDRHVLELNRQALAALTCEKLLRIVPGAGHLFEEPDALETVTEMACAWFQHYLEPRAGQSPATTAPQRRRPGRRRRFRSLQRSATAVEPLPAIEDPTFAEAFDRFAISARRAARRGVARHFRVLSRPRRHHPAPDRAPRLQHRGCGGRLAGRRAPSIATCASGPIEPMRSIALHPVSDLDVAEPGCRRFRGVPAPPQLGEAGRRAGWFLWPRPLQHDRLDRGCARLPRPGRPRERQRRRAPHMVASPRGRGSSRPTDGPR